MGWKQLKVGVGQRSKGQAPARRHGTGSSEPPRNRHPTRTRSLPEAKRVLGREVVDDIVLIVGLIVVAILFYASVKFGCASGVEPEMLMP